MKSSCWRGALVGEAVGAEVVAVRQHPLPHVVDADVVQRRAGHHRRRPLAAAAHQPQRAGQLAGGRPGLLLAVAVGLVDRDHVGDLEDALLDALELVAGAGQGEEEEGVDHAGHGDLGLADADGLDQHHVVRRRLEHRHRLHGRPGDAAEGAGGRRRPDVGVAGRPTSRAIRVLSPSTEPPVRMLDGSTASTPTRWPWPVSRVPRASMNVDLPDAGHAGDADPHRRRAHAAAASSASAVSSSRAAARCSRLDDSTSVIACETAARRPVADALDQRRRRRGTGLSGPAARAAGPAGRARTRR